MTETATQAVFPLLWSDDPGGIADWAIASLGLTEAWRAPGDDGGVEHVELLWPGGGYVSINIRHDAAAGTGAAATGPAGIGLRFDDRTQVEKVHTLALAAGARISQPLAESRVAYSFTALDPDGNQWWVHAETGFLDELRR